MQKVIHISRFGFLKEKQRSILVELISYLLVLLFVYTAASKLLTIETFTDVLSKYPLIGGYPEFVAYFIPLAELLTAALLIIPSLRRFGLFASSFLMLSFLLYIIYLFVFNQALPCSCGGIISKLSWQQHIWFNSFFLFLSLIGLKMYKK